MKWLAIVPCALVAASCARAWDTGATAAATHVTAAATPPATAPSASLRLPGSFTAVGTEPFWSAKVDGERLTYMTPENQAGRTITVERSSSASGRPTVSLRGQLEGKPLVLILSAGPCSDGMSDTRHPFAAERRLGQNIVHGCARLP